MLFSCEETWTRPTFWFPSWTRKLVLYFRWTPHHFHTIEAKSCSSTLANRSQRSWTSSHRNCSPVHFRGTNTLYPECLAPSLPLASSSDSKFLSCLFLDSSWWKNLGKWKYRASAWNMHRGWFGGRPTAWCRRAAAECIEGRIYSVFGLIRISGVEFVWSGRLLRLYR